MNYEIPLDYLVDSLIPEHIKKDYPNYVLFITEYLKYLESSGGPVYFLKHLLNYIDINNVPESVLSHYIEQYASSFPSSVLDNLDVRVFIKNAKEFYSSKGTEQSYRFVFNMLGDTDIDIYYPKDHIFIISQSLISGMDVSEFDLLTDPDEIRLNSEADRIHDNFYYAFFTYDITTILNPDEYRDIVKSTIHPAGFKLFTKYNWYINDLAAISYDPTTVGDGGIEITHQMYEAYLYPQESEDYSFNPISLGLDYILSDLLSDDPLMSELMLIVGNSEIPITTNFTMTSGTFSPGDYFNSSSGATGEVLDFDTVPDPDTLEFIVLSGTIQQGDVLTHDSDSGIYGTVG